MRNNSDRLWGALAVLLAAILLISAGCGHAPSNAQGTNRDSSASPGTVSAGSSEGQLPFTTGSAQSGSSTGNNISELVPDSLTLPAGTPVSIRLQSAVSSATAHPGDHFEAVLDEPLVIEGHTVASRGAAVIGRVMQARSSGHLHNSGFLRLTLASIMINGKQVPVRATSVFIQGGSHKKRNFALIGGGGGAGALIGGLAGGGKGALIGGLIGTGGGTGVAYATGKKEVGFGPERRLTFRLIQPVLAG